MSGIMMAFIAIFGRLAIGYQTVSKDIKIKKDN
jgi:hypothetical protein